MHKTKQGVALVELAGCIDEPENDPHIYICVKGVIPNSKYTYNLAR